MNRDRLGRWARVLAVAVLLAVWVIGAVLAVALLLFLGPRSGCPPLLIPVGSKYTCDAPFWIGIFELLLVLGFWVTYLIVVPLLIFSRMINWASSGKIRRA